MKKLTKLERLQDSLIYGLLHVATGVDADFTVDAAKELETIREEGLMDTLEAFNNCLWSIDEENNTIMGWERTHDIFEKFMSEYPNITKVLTIYCYS